MGAVVDRLAKPFVIVGQSMGAPIAELAAAARPDRALGLLLLLTRVRLAGMRLPDAVVETFRALGGATRRTPSTVGRELGPPRRS